MAMSMIKAFRRNRKAYLAGLTIVTMLAFVFIPPLLERLGEFTRKDDLVVTSRFGKLRQSQLDRIIQEQMLLAGFLQGVSSQLMEKNDFMRGQQLRMTAEQMMAQGRSEEDAVRHWLLQERGREMGIQVSRDAINEQLKLLAGEKLTNADIKRVLSGKASSHAMTQPQLFSLLGRFMLAQRVESLLAPAAAITPAEDYSYFLQLQRKAQIETVGVPVTQWTSKVAEPGNEELTTFFEQYKNVPYSPNLPTPGLKQPHRVKLCYLKADYAKFVNVKAISEERIREYYQQNKEVYREPEAPPAAVGGKPEAKPDAKPSAKPELKPEEKPLAKTESKPQSKPEAKPDAKPSVKPDAKPDAKAPSKTSDGRRGVKIRLVADEKAAPASPAVPSAPAAAPSAPARPDAAKPAAPAVDAKSPAKPAGTLPKAPSAVAVDAKLPAAPPRYTPLEKVHDDIAKQLAEMDAEKKIRDALTEVQDIAAKYLSEKQTRKFGSSDGPPLVEPNWAELAKQRGLSLHRTEWVSQWDVAALDIGRSLVEGRPFAGFVFGAMRETQASLSTDSDRNEYVFWKTEETQAAVGSLDDAVFRASVVEAWKKIQARGLAQKEAQRLTDLTRAAKKPLKDALASQKELKVLAPEPFSWYTSSYVSPQMFAPQMQLSAVVGVESAGMEFMRTVFAMKPGEIATAWNEPQTIAYVVQLTEFSPRENTLWTEFMASQGSGRRQTAQLARNDLIQLRRQWVESLEKDAQLHWEREPARARRDADGEGAPADESPAGRDDES